MEACLSSEFLTGVLKITVEQYINVMYSNNSSLITNRLPLLNPTQDRINTEHISSNNNPPIYTGSGIR